MKKYVFIFIPLLFLLLIGFCLWLNYNKTGYLDLVDNKKHYTNYLGNQFNNNYAIIYHMQLNTIYPDLPLCSKLSQPSHLR